MKQVSFGSPSFSVDNFSTYYGFDKTGRLENVTGSPFAGIINYVTQMKYRAFGVIKSLAFGNSTTLNASYNARQQVAAQNLKNTYGYTITDKSYHYYSDGRLNFADDKFDNNWDRALNYDQVGRITAAYTGERARNFYNSLPIGIAIVPFHQANTYDVWNNRLTQTGAVDWRNPVNETDSFQALTGKHIGWVYDEAGNIINNGTDTLSYDAAGRNVLVKQGDFASTQSHNGDGLVVKQYSTFYINSSMLGGKVLVRIKGSAADIYDSRPQGRKLSGEVYSGNTGVAIQLPGHGYPTDFISWGFRDMVTGSSYSPPTVPLITIG